MGSKNGVRKWVETGIKKRVEIGYQENIENTNGLPCFANPIFTHFFRNGHEVVMRLILMR